jgi:hypothetical protein
MAVQSTFNAAPAVAYRGMLAVGGPQAEVLTMVNNEASAEMAFGLAVAFEGSTDDNGALAPDATSDVIAGILVHSHDYSNSADGLLGTTGVKPTGRLNVLRRGWIWVKVEEAVVPGDRMFIRAVATGGEEEGALRKSADSTDCIDSTGQGVFLTTAAANGLAVLAVDFNALPA